MVTTVTNNSPQAINTSLFSLQKEIDDLRRQINQINSKNAVAESELAKGLVPDDTPDMSVDEIKKLIPDTATPENQLADKDFVNSEISSVKSEIGGKADKIHTHTKSEITDFPTSLPANGGTADKATNANLSKTLDTVNGDKLQIGNGTAQNVTNAKHAATADAFSTTYISNITPAQAAAMEGGSTIWPLSYDKNYLQTVSVTWHDYSSHTFPAGAAGMFFPGYSSNGGTLILINYVSSRVLYNVWMDSNRWSGWHYIDMPAISYT